MACADLRELLLEKGDVIWRDQMHVVREFPVDTRACNRFLERQREISGETNPCVPKVLQTLIQSIRRVSRAQVFDGMQDMAANLWDSLSKSSNPRFYVALSGDTRDVCFSKSTVFVSIMMMASNKDLAEHFCGFLCRGHLLECAADDAETHAVGHVVYADDASFTGSQLTDGIRALDPRHHSLTLHIAILYISTETRHKVHENIRQSFANLKWYASPHIKQNVNLLQPVSTLFDSENERKIAHTFLDHPDLFSPSLSSVLDKPMFYTDLKAPDQMSSHPHFLLHPHLISDNHAGTKTPLGESLLSGCKPPTDSDTTRQMMAGTLCPKPAYKRVRWYPQILEIGQSGTKRKRPLT